MKDAYSSEEFTTPSGKKFRLELAHDYSSQAPWEWTDGHGAVSEWTSRDKKSGEIVLCEERGSKRFYDFQGAVKLARQDGWNVEPYEHDTNGIQAEKAAKADFEYLRAWCNNDWWYACIRVVLLDENGVETDYEEYLGMVEDRYDKKFRAYVMKAAMELIENIEHTFDSDNSEEQTSMLHSIKDDALFMAGIV